MEDSAFYEYAMTDHAILVALGQFVRQSRLQKNQTQQQLAAAAGLNRSTIVQLEKGGAGTMLSFIQVLRALEMLALLKPFEVKREISPILLAEMEHKIRKRARPLSSKNLPKSEW